MIKAPPTPPATSSGVVATARIALGVLVLVLAVGAPVRPAAAETNRVTDERIVKDPYSALAIGGHDPVAYFVNGRARIGKRSHATMWRGAQWRFVNEGNLAAFRTAPAVYAPRFGGYDAMAAARGFVAVGTPLIWSIHDGALYFFQSRGNQFAWRTDPGRFAADARDNWPRLVEGLAR